MNITWSEAQNSEDQASLNVLEHWDGANTNIYVTLVIFIVLKVLIGNIYGPSCSTMDSAVCWINHYTVDKYQGLLHYLIDRDKSSGLKNWGRSWFLQSFWAVR